MKDHVLEGEGGQEKEMSKWRGKKKAGKGVKTGGKNSLILASDEEYRFSRGF